MFDLLYKEKLYRNVKAFLFIQKHISISNISLEDTLTPKNSTVYIPIVVTVNVWAISTELLTINEIQWDLLGWSALIIIWTAWFTKPLWTPANGSNTVIGKL